MKISIITVCYNSEKTIEATLKSVGNQSYENIEYIVIDGASVDNTLEIIEKYKNKIAYFISEPDEGMYYAMNKGIKAATGDWIFILNSDDQLMEKEVIKKAVEQLKGFDGDILLGDIFLDHSIDANLHNRKLSYKHLNIMEAFYKGLYQQAIFYKKELFYKFDYFDESYKLAADIDWFYKFYQKCKIKYVQQIFCKFLIGGRSNNEEFSQVAIYERKKIADTYLQKRHMIIYENLKAKEKIMYRFFHKYFRSIARNTYISQNAPILFWNLISIIYGWKVYMVKD